MTQVYGVYVNCGSLAELQARREEERALYKKMHALTAYKQLYQAYPFALEEMIGTAWVNVGTFHLVEIDEIIEYDNLRRDGPPNAYYDDGCDRITIYREISGKDAPCIEHWVRIDHLSPELQLEFLIERWKYLTRKPRNQYEYVSPRDAIEAENQWNEIEWFCHHHKLERPKKPVKPGEQIPMFDF